MGEQVETVHVRNTGRLRELLVKDVPVLLEPAANPDRKTRYSLICVQKMGNGSTSIPQRQIRLLKRWSGRAVSFLILLM